MELKAELAPTHLDIEDQSAQHAHHAAMRDHPNAQHTHLALNIVSDQFEGKSLVQRHQLIYKMLDQELKTGLHALVLHTKTTQEAKQ
jgi:stress-induced morphogen